MIRRLMSVLACAMMLGTSAAAAQDGARSLHWRRIDVNAELQADGRLHVRERQTMVFTGDWNGGERSFNLRPGQKLKLNGITRLDPDGSTHALESGDLEDVDQFDWTDSRTLRWRSRLPSDPVFDRQEIIYELDYTLSNILQPDDDGYLLDHDFAFPDRAGVIEAFALDLRAPQNWISNTRLPLHLERKNLVPGESMVVTAPLQYTGPGWPAGVARGVPLLVRLLNAFLFVAIIASMVRRFFADETARGRFAPLTPVESIDEEWLGTHVFSVPPEVVGAAWDNSTAAPEVAAMIARMAQEGKLVSSVTTKGRKEILHLELKVLKADLKPNERKLINALFTGDKTTTDTERIKKRYQSSGFDPAALISEDIQAQIDARAPTRKSHGRKTRVLFYMLTAMLVIGSGIAAVALTAGSAAMAAPIGATIACFVALIMAGVYRSTVVDTPAKARPIVAFLALAVVAVLVVMLGLFERDAALSLASVILPAYAGAFAAIAMMVMVIGMVFLTLEAARTKEDPVRLELRRTLAAARAFFARELAKPQPLLDDAWFPYLLAFGLGNHIDKWFRAFGGETSNLGVASASGMAAAASSGGWSGGGPMFGGGGGFGGGGSGRTWAAAVETMSAGVSAPSSSSSGGGGGGGGGGSSGGGGGGGW